MRPDSGIGIKPISETGIERTIRQRKVTYDLARQMEGATELKTSQFGDAIISNM